MSTNYLFYKRFQVISEFVYTNGIHKATKLYGFSVRV
jgi:hypothetical protein